MKKCFMSRIKLNSKFQVYLSSFEWKNVPFSNNLVLETNSFSISSSLAIKEILVEISSTVRYIYQDKHLDFKQAMTPLDNWRKC